MMTASRSFAPLTEAQDGAPPPVFPLLPFAFTAYAEHCSRDYADHLGRLAHVDEQPLDPQDAFGLNMLTDMNQAFFNLVWAPFGVAVSRTKI
jgi:hypothetical protein